MSKSTRDNVHFTLSQSNIQKVGLQHEVELKQTFYKMVNIIHRIGIKSGPDKVYKAISTIEGLAGWWTQEVEGSEQLGGRLKFTFRTEGGDIKGQMVMEVKELTPEKGVKWQCVERPVNGLERILRSICHNKTIRRSSYLDTVAGRKPLSLLRTVA